MLEASRTRSISIPISSTPAITSEDFTDDPDWTGECGQRDVRGAGTESYTKRGEFPWSVAVFAHTKVLGKLQYVFLCGGTLIDEPVVITAAACIQHKHLSELFVHVGLWDIDASSDRFTQIIKVEEVEVHKGYDPSSLINNIALLVLKDSARRGRSVNRVCLPEGNQKFETDSTCYVVGWEDRRSSGGSNALLKLAAKQAGRDECTNYIKHISGVLKYKLPKEHLCADYGQVTDEQNLPVPCARGPGSGMVCTLNNKREQFFLVGIASHSLRQCTPAYDVFQKTENYISWVDTLMKKYSRDQSYYRPDPNGDNEDADEDEDEDRDTSS
ncbi:hypothetical protein ZHAS_00003410 [Anopheles sinensis]|uniref:Peptidase S1 domain-containing protein n=1 Tax=Anopheles sinensis TaxID=74873 RepID=A0A084VE54_ANOSI|nr:hypothetical protein ZHAS_00003410 [Anopheles sinensis]